MRIWAESFPASGAPLPRPVVLSVVENFCISDVSGIGERLSFNFAACWLRPCFGRVEIWQAPTSIGSISPRSYLAVSKTAAAPGSGRPQDSKEQILLGVGDTTAAGDRP